MFLRTKIDTLRVPLLWVLEVLVLVLGHNSFNNITIWIYLIDIARNAWSSNSSHWRISSTWCSCMFWSCYGSACELSGWTCQQTSYHNGRSRRASLLCEISYVLVATRDDWKPSRKPHTCGWGCEWGCALTRRACWHTSDKRMMTNYLSTLKHFLTLLQMWHFLALLESRVLWVCLCLERLLLVA